MQKLCEEAKNICHKCYDRMELYGYQCTFLNKNKSCCGTILVINEDVKILKRLQDINISSVVSKMGE